MVSPTEQQKFGKQFSAEDDAGVSSSPEAGPIESLSCKLIHFIHFPNFLVWFGYQLILFLGIITFLVP